MIRISPRFISGPLVALFFGISLFIRARLPYDRVFVDNWIKFTSNDAYRQMRLVDNLVHNFPNLHSFDPYLIYPGGSFVGSGIRFFNWLLAAITWVIGGGAPTEHTIDVIGVYFPAVLGALIVIPVYLLGKELFGRWAGVFAAALIAIMPGEFLGRSILGFTDHHVAEALFTTVIMLFLIMAVKSAGLTGLGFSKLKRKENIRPLVYSLLSGFSLGIYLLTWQGGLLFVFIIFLYFIIQSVIDHIRGRATDYLVIISAALFIMTAIVFLPFYFSTFYLVPLIIALLTPFVLNRLSRLLTVIGVKPAFFPLAMAGLGIVGLSLLYLILPAMVTGMLSQFSVFTPTGTELTTLEMQPLFKPSGAWSTEIAWGNFTTSLLLIRSLPIPGLGIIALGILIYLVIKQGNAEKTVLVVWSLMILAATIGQRRFGYYFSVNMALLTGYLCWQALRTVSLRETIPGKIWEKTEGLKIIRWGIVAPALLAVIYFVAFHWNVEPARQVAQSARFAPSNAWVSSLDWMRDNTPEPFGDPDFYYSLETNTRYRSLAELKRMYPNTGGDPEFYYKLEESYPYPESAYGVMAWWDYGYWITRIAHRIPNANPAQDPDAITSVATFFTSQDKDVAGAIADELKSAYIIIDNETSTSKFWAVATWAGLEPSDYIDVYWVPRGNQLVPVRLFSAEYYHSIVSRLYNFDGEAIDAQQPIVISYQAKTNQNGENYKELTFAQDFASYQEAQDFISSQESGDYKIVGANPLVSPVPLEALDNYHLVYSSDNLIQLSETTAVAEVKIFEYRK